MSSLGVSQINFGKIPLSAKGIVNLWDDAWAATQRAMGYSVEALSQTRDIGSFLRAVRPQAALTRLIGGEVDEIGSYFPVMQRSDRDVIRRWQHDRFASQAVTLFGITELAGHMPDLSASWYERARRTYAHNPSLSHIVNGAVESQMIMLRARNIAIDVDVDGEGVFFVNRRVRQLATDIITNLISNAVKYSCNGGTIRVVFRDRTFSVEDEGIGMNAPFARLLLLGQPDPIREMRAKDIQGFGFGWTTIGRALDRLGWRRGIDTEPNVGSKFTVTMQEDHLLSHQRVTPIRFDKIDLFEILAQGNAILHGAKPLADYHIVTGDYLDVSGSPAAWVIEAIGKVDAQYAIPN